LSSARRVSRFRQAFSLTRYAPAAVLIAILLADSNRHTDPDLWGHLRFGQAFIAGGHLLHRDTYSYFAAGHRWRDHEWLAEVVMAFVYNAAGVAGLKLWKFACTAAALLFVADTEALPARRPPSSLSSCSRRHAGSCCRRSFARRCSALCCWASCSPCLRATNRRDAWLWLAVPLMALWANLHGGFFIGTAALALYSTVAALDDLAAGAEWRRGAQLSLLTIVAVAATPVNPYGVGMWETVAHALGNPFTRNAINDWQPFGGRCWRSGIRPPPAAPIASKLIVAFQSRRCSIRWRGGPSGPIRTKS